VTAALGDRFKGYAVILQDEQRRPVVAAQYGYARTPCEPDGAQPFTADTKINWGSVSKMITSAAALHVIDHNTPITLDRRMMLYLPQQWRPEVHPDFQPVTIRHLLQHRAGFAKSAPRDGRGDPRHIRVRLQGGAEISGGTEAPGGGERRYPRSYSNTSMGLFHFLGSYFDPEAMATAEARFNSTEIAYDDYVQVHTSRIYTSYVQRHVLQPLGINASCDVAAFKGGNYALLYGSAASARGHKTADGRANCAAGGWVMSASDMATFIHALAHTGRIISPATYALMENRADPDGRLGWATAVDTTGGLAFKHNGLNHAGDGSVHTEVYSFPNGFQAVAVVNSAAPEGFSVGRALRLAYEAALEKGGSS
jgi:CubicO group peptidase (beta-lactamase class C family)